MNLSGLSLRLTPGNRQSMQPSGRAHKTTLLTVALAATAVVALLLNLAIGAYVIALEDILRSIGSLAGLLPADAADSRDVAVLTTIRMPRTLLAAMSGAGLALSGAVLQGLFRNPLADPGIIGVSGGAALGAALAIVGAGFLPAAVRPFASGVLLPASAFATALATTIVVYRLGRGTTGPSVALMLLAGIACNAIAFAGVGFLSFVATDEQLRSLTFWNLGSVGGATWTHIAVCAAVTMPAASLLLRLASQLDALSLGFDEARHIGVDIERFKRRAVVLATLVVGVLVSLTGVIGFVGLVAPHMVRLAIGPGHRSLLPLAALLGATLLMAADLLSRTIVAPAELPVGILTTAAGAPFFLWLLVRSRREVLS